MEVTDNLPENGVVCWPSFISRFKRLRKVVININVHYQGLKVPISSPRPDLLPPTLEEIFFCFVQAESCFMRFPPSPTSVYSHQLPQNPDADLETSPEPVPNREEDKKENAKGDDQNSGQHTSEMDVQVPISPKLRIYTQKDDNNDTWIDDELFNWTKRFPRLRVLTLLGRPAFNAKHLDNMPSNIENLTLLSDRLTREWENSAGKIRALTYQKHARKLASPSEPRPFLTNVHATSLSYQFSSYTVMDTLKLTVKKWTWDLWLLPASLTHLDITIPNTSNDSTENDSHTESTTSPEQERMDSGKSSASQWPHLTSISLSGVDWPSSWPKSLETLKSHACKRIERQDIASLPRKLKSLTITSAFLFMPPEANNWKLEYLSDLPTTITHLNLPACESSQRTEYGGIRNRFWCTEQALKGFSTFPCLTSIKLTPCLSPETLAMLPATLKTLDCALNFPVIRPPGQMMMMMVPPRDPKTLAELPWPPALTDLRCTLGDLAPKLDRYFAMSLPRQLLKLQIESGTVFTDFLETLPPQLTFLGYQMRSHGSTLPSILPRLLPRTLTSLNLPAVDLLDSESIAQFPRSLIKCPPLLSASVLANKKHLLPPSCAIKTSLIACVAAHDLPENSTSVK